MNDLTTLKLDDDLDRRRHARALAERIDGDVRFERHDRMLYSTDASLYQVEPIGVVIPRSTADVEAVVEYCRDHGMPILPRGGGTSLAGQCVNRAVVIDFSVHCRNLLDVDLDARTCRVQPGIVLDELNEQLDERTDGALWFGPDVATARHANIGGMIGNNSAGAHSILYGRTVEHIVGLDVLTAAGERLSFTKGASKTSDRIRALTQQLANIIVPAASLIRERFPKTRRRVDGYNLDLFLDQLEASRPGAFDAVNLAHLICGSEGTLAVTTEATLNLVDRPKRKGLAVVGFESLDAAMDAVNPLIETGPSAIELLDDTIINLARTNLEYSRYVDLLPTPESGVVRAVLYVEYFGDSEEELRERMRAVAGTLPGAPVELHTDAASMLNAWKLRKAGEPLLHAVPGARKPLTFVEDTAVDPKRLPEFVKDFRAIVEKQDTFAAFYAHASVGCLHIRPMLSLRDPGDLERMQTIAEEVTDLVRQYGGALSGEHGDGRVRSPFLERFFGPELMDVFRRVKGVFDPDNRLNPGNIVEPHPMAQHFRTNPEGRPVAVPEIDTFFDYSEEAGFDHAVELCNGSGVCRKKAGGTMCPSYKATLDERHSTRGRGNALRLAITGQLNETFAPEWNDDETLETLRLCLSCKGCKTECPSNVDIGKYKAEYLAQSYRADGGPPLQARAFGSVRRLNRLGSRFAPLSNFIANLGPVRRLTGRMLKLAPQRTLPAFSRSLERDLPHRSSASYDGLDADAPVVILYADCFTTWNDAHIGRATVESLNAFGYRVRMPKVHCCGRAPISTGLLDQARDGARRSFQALKRAVKETDAVAIVVCEPSCLSAIKDEWRVLNIGDAEEVDAIAKLAALPEQFLDQHWTDHPRRPEFTSRDDAVILHGHCHQKALWGADSSASLLRRVCHDAGGEVQVLDTGCCGMAGSFGYTADRYDLSMRIGELDLFPQLRESPAAAVVVAPGTSCRHQIADGVEREAIHPMQYVRDRLQSPSSKSAD
ncbi:MAG: FAD-linked oxidase C-terminal domain-containing protein [Phycisphaerales bacterium]